uniref:Uncharacterized protein n=1 Tax=Streptomyces sp. F12 TaxID=1436084 RepID=V9Z870_9ACTN|nr:hypothetical protein pFRL6_221 [Streptomyces sp. F12]
MSDGGRAARGAARTSRYVRSTCSTWRLGAARPVCDTAARRGPVGLDAQGISGRTTGSSWGGVETTAPTWCVAETQQVPPAGQPSGIAALEPCNDALASVGATAVTCTMGPRVTSWCPTALTHTNRAVSAAASQHARAADPTDLRALLSPCPARFIAADSNGCVPPRMRVRCGRLPRPHDRESAVPGCPADTSRRAGTTAH